MLSPNHLLSKPLLKSILHSISSPKGSPIFLIKRTLTFLPEFSTLCLYCGIMYLSYFFLNFLVYKSFKESVSLCLFSLAFSTLLFTQKVHRKMFTGKHQPEFSPSHLYVALISSVILFSQVSVISSAKWE